MNFDDENQILNMDSADPECSQTGSTDAADCLNAFAGQEGGNEINTAEIMVSADNVSGSDANDNSSNSQCVDNYDYTGMGHEQTSMTPDLPSPEEPDFETMCAALDGILLIQNKPISYEKIAPILGTTPAKAEEVVFARKRDYDNDLKSGLQIVITDSGVQLATKAKVTKFIQRMDGQKLVSLSLPALETLSVIAFKQPITKAEVDAVRGVNCDGVISNLLEKKLIYVSGEKSVIGHPRLYSTTQDFLFYFGMKSLKELPKPMFDLPEELTPEGQSAEAEREKEESSRLFNESQGFVSAEPTEKIVSDDKSDSVEELADRAEADQADNAEKDSLGFSKIQDSESELPE